MCDLFQANPWKPLLCTNCHQNRSGHQTIENCLHTSKEQPSSMHLYEEIMAQYFTTNVEEEIPPTISIGNDEDSFTDEDEEDLPKIEFIQNQTMINTQGIVLMGPDLPSKEVPEKKMKKINLLKKSKSNADECLKKTEIIENNNSSKLWWFKARKANGLPVEVNPEMTKSQVTSPIITNQKIRVLPEINKLTLNEALSIARRQHPSPKIPLNIKPMPPIYNSSIASTTSSSSAEYETNPIREESTYLTAIPPIDKDTIFDQTNKLVLERLTFDLRILIDEYKKNLPVARFQTFKSFLDQDQLIKTLSNESIYFLLLQILDEFSQHSISDHFLITYHSTIPILVPTSSITNSNHQESIEEVLQNLAKKFFHPSSLPNFPNLLTFKTLSYRYLFNQIFQYPITDSDNNIPMQRVKLLNLFCNKIQSIRNIQMNEDNERSIFALYYLMRFSSQSDN